MPGAEPGCELWELALCMPEERGLSPSVVTLGMSGGGRLKAGREVAAGRREAKLDVSMSSWFVPIIKAPCVSRRGQTRSSSPSRGEAVPEMDAVRRIDTRCYPCPGDQSPLERRPR